jgi:DNA primase
LKDGTWRYRPSKIPANPLILGSLLNKRLFVCEGQWDAITLAGAAGYFDSCWEEDYGKNNSCAVAIRGVSGYGLFLDILKQRNLVFDKPEVFLFRDNDKAGETWRDKFAPRLAELASVRLFRPAEGKDINEIHKANPLTLADVEQTLGGKS